MADTPEKPETARELPDTVQVDVGKLRALYNPEARLVFSYRGQDYEMSPDMRVFVLGRSPESNLRVDATCTSREHARVVYRKGKFVLVDQSTNGTFVRQAGASEILLVQDDEFPLTSAGVIGLGQSTKGSTEELIRYRCERCSPVFL